VKLRHWQTIYSLLFLLGLVVLVSLYVYFPPRNLGGMAPAFVFGPLWTVAFIGALVLTWREPGWSGGFLTNLIAFIVLLVFTISMYSGGSGRQPIREVRTAIKAWQYPDTVTYSDLYVADISPRREWVDPRRAAALLKFRDSIPDAGCAVGYRPLDTVRRSHRALSRVYFVEWRDERFTTSDPGIRIESIGSDTVRIGDRFQKEEVVIELRLEHLITRPKDAGPYLTVIRKEVPTGIRVETGCPKMWPEDVFSRRFYHFLQRRGWPE
jgi:hypothetical protein